MNFAWLYRHLRANVKLATPPVSYDPVYGLSKAAVDAWLAHNPELRRQHEIELGQHRCVK